MALTLSTSGLDISTEEFFVSAVSDNPLIKSVQLKFYVQGVNGGAELHVIEQGPDLGTTNQFTFEINQVLKPYFLWDFHPLGSTTKIDQLNVLSSLFFQEYDVNTPYGGAFYFYNLKNMTFTPIELNDLDLTNYDMSSGTGNKFLTSGPASLDVPDNRTLWMSVLKAASTQTSPSTLSEIGTLSYGNFDYAEIVDGGNGFMYLIPFNADDLLKLNPLTGSITTISTGGVSAQAYLYAKKASNGKIYCSPYGETRVMVIDPSTDAISFISGVGAGIQKYAVVSEVSNILYFAPQSATSIMKVDTSIDSLSFDAGSYTGYAASVSVGTLIYFFPVVFLGTILKFDTITTASSTIAIDSNYTFTNGVYYNTSNNSIYAVPANVPSGGKIVKIDVSTDAISFFGPTLTSLQYIDTCIGGDGRLYSPGQTVQDVLVIDMTNDTTSTLSPTAGSNYNSCDTFSDGNIYSIPYNSSFGDVLKITMPVVGDSQELVVESFNPTGISLGETTYSIDRASRSYPSGLSTTPDIWVKPLSLSSGSSVKSINVWVRDISSPFTIRSEVKTFVNQNYGLTFCNGFRVHWLNEFGCQDSYTFNGRLSKTIETVTKDYQNVDIGTLVYHNDYNDSWSLTTLEESPDVVEWLTKIMRNKRAVIENIDPNSPAAYFEIEILGANKLYRDNRNALSEFVLNFRFAKTRKGIQ